MIKNDVFERFHPNVMDQRNEGHNHLTKQSISKGVTMKVPMKNGMQRIIHGTVNMTKIKSIADKPTTPQNNRKSMIEKLKQDENVKIELSKRMTLAEYSLLRQSEKENIAKAYLETLNTQTRTYELNSHD